MQQQPPRFDCATFLRRLVGAFKFFALYSSSSVLGIFHSVDQLLKHLVYSEQKEMPNQHFSSPPSAPSSTCDEESGAASGTSSPIVPDHFRAVTLMILRHGESEWNNENRFTSWVDKPLTEKGREQARKCAKLILEAGITVDEIHSSVLSRARETAALVAAGLAAAAAAAVGEGGAAGAPAASAGAPPPPASVAGGEGPARLGGGGGRSEGRPPPPPPPVRAHWRLNERHYGALVGLNKAEAAARWGEARVKRWRRDRRARPPPMGAAHPCWPEVKALLARCGGTGAADAGAAAAPSGPGAGEGGGGAAAGAGEAAGAGGAAGGVAAESLEDLAGRALPCFRAAAAPALRAGRSVLIVTHSNVARALVSYLEGLNDDEIMELNIPTGIPILYHLDPRSLSILAPRQYLGNPEKVKLAIENVASESCLKQKKTN